VAFSWFLLFNENIINKAAEYYARRELQFKNRRKRQNTFKKTAEFYEKNILCSIDHFIALVRFWKYHKTWFRRMNVQGKYGYHTGEKRTLNIYKECCIKETIIVEMSK